MSAFWSSEVKHCPMIPEFTSEFCSCFTLVLVSLFLLCGICVWKTRCYLTITTRTLWIFLSLKKNTPKPSTFQHLLFKENAASWYVSETLFLIQFPLLHTFNYWCSDALNSLWFTRLFVWDQMQWSFICKNCKIPLTAEMICEPHKLKWS